MITRAFLAQQDHDRSVRSEPKSDVAYIAHFQTYSTPAQANDVCCGRTAGPLMGGAYAQARR